MLVKTPMATRVLISDDPPYDIKGSGIPVKGTKATMAERLSKN